MIYATLYFAYFRHGRNWLTETEHLMIPIYRIRTIPTQLMLDNNISKWSEGWNNSLTSTEPNSGLFLYENGMPVRSREKIRRHPCAPCTPCTRLRRSTLPRSSSPSLPPPPSFTFGRSFLGSLSALGSTTGGRWMTPFATGAGQRCDAPLNPPQLKHPFTCTLFLYAVFDFCFNHDNRSGNHTWNS